jgi:two-component system osmolarity sensor histidine kinase EnvZ
MIQIRIGIDGRGVLVFDMPEYRLYTATSYIFVLWMLGSAVVLFTIAVLFMRNQVRPIRRLAVAVESFGRGMDAPDFRPEGALEVRQAGVSFLKMRERIRRQVEQRTAMLNGISHDLRTPVTRMKIEIEMLEDRETAEALKSDLDAMEKMLEGYLAFARGEQDEKGEALSLNRFLGNVVENARRQGGNIVFHADHLPEIQCEVKALALSRALSNIIDNGCKYGTTVEVSLNLIQNDAGHDLAEILVEDNGPGIPEDSYGEVFRPFVRLEKSRNPETGGIGLGLSVAQDIIHSHGGHITLGARKDGKKGLAVAVVLPV